MLYVLCSYQHNLVELKIKMKITIPDFKNSNVLVVGDLMLDRYWHGDTSRISPEAPVPVVKVGDAEERAGGAGNVALNIAALGGHSTVLGLVGDDEAASALKKVLEYKNIQCNFQTVKNSKTITKLRIISRHQQLIRLDFEDGFMGCDHSGLNSQFQNELDAATVVVLSDYGKGTLQDIQTLIRLAREAGKTILVDPKGNDFTRYQGASLITPNLSEFEAVVGVCHSDDELVSKGMQLLDELQLDALLVTRSEKGMTLLRHAHDALHFPALTREVFDVTGAGDTVIAALAASMAAGQSLDEATALANQAAGIAVSKLGTATVSIEELQHALRDEAELASGVMDEIALKELVDAAKARGETVVMTNGCFDILHAGHVTYLEQAAQQGDRLIVAVNDDATVRRLKGADRPVNTMERRMRMLSALSCVDWVVPFYDETPTELICHISPDILVKGGDNDPDNIPGGDCVRDAGGEVRVMSYVDGVSTTGIISSIREKE